MHLLSTNPVKRLAQLQGFLQFKVVGCALSIPKGVKQVDNETFPNLGFVPTGEVNVLPAVQEELFGDGEFGHNLYFRNNSR